jgi:hypothetical protein
MDDYPQGACQAVKDLAEGFSIQSKLTNRMWLAVVAVAILILLPVDVHKNSEYRTLPFGFGEIDNQDFNIVSTFILSIISIAFCAARSQALIAYKFAHAEISKLGTDDYVRKQRRYFDILTSPTLVRVGPLSIVLKENFPNVGKRVQFIFSFIYLVIKILAIAVFLGVPVFAAVSGGISVLYDNKIDNILKVLCLSIIAIDILIILLVLIIDLIYAGVIYKRLPSKVN